MDGAFVRERIVNGVGEFTFRVGGACSVTVTVHALQGTGIAIGETTVCTSRGYCVLEHALLCRGGLVKIERLQTTIRRMLRDAHRLEWDGNNTTSGFKSKAMTALCNEVVDRWVAWLAAPKKGSRRRGSNPRPQAQWAITNPNRTA